MCQPSCTRLTDGRVRRDAANRIGHDATVCVSAAPAWAHHDAIYGPQSALVLSGERYLTVQVFSRQTGPKDGRVQETTTVLSGGLAFRRLPVSLSIVVPFSVIAYGIVYRYAERR